MGTNSTGCTEWERDFDPETEQPQVKRLAIYQSLSQEIAQLASRVNHLALELSRAGATSDALASVRHELWELSTTAFRAHGLTSDIRFEEEVEQGLRPRDYAQSVVVSETSAIVSAEELGI